MTWIDSKFADETLFPMEGNISLYITLCFDNVFTVPPAGEFPKRFESEVRTILKRMFRVYAHIYHSHLTAIKSMGSESSDG